jgi:hypothetical protein
MAYKKPFGVADFGMCYLEDLVNEVKDNKELVVEADKDIIKLYRKGKIELLLKFAIPCSLHVVLQNERT